MTTTQTQRTFQLHNGRPVHNLAPDADVVTSGGFVIPDVSGLTIPEAARVWRKSGFAVFPWRLIDTGKNLGAFVGKGYHQLAAAITPEQAYELAALDGDITGLGLSCGRSGIIVFDLDKPELCPPLLRKAIEELQPPYQTTRDQPTVEGLLPRGHYIFRMPAGRRMGSPTKWTADNPPSLGWGEVRCWNSGIAIAPGLHPKAAEGGRYAFARIGEIPELPYYLAVTLPEFLQTADRATKQEIEAIKLTMTRRTDPAAMQRITEKHDDGTLSGRHGATLNLALDAFREMVAGRITYGDAVNTVHEFFYSMVTDPSRRNEPALLCEWALGQVLTDAATGGVAGLANAGVPTTLPEGTDPTQVNARAIRTRELYRRCAGRPIGLADDIQRTRAVLASATKRVANSPSATRFVADVDKHIVPLVLDLILHGTPRQGSKAETIAAHTATKEAMQEAIQKATNELVGGTQKEVAEVTAQDGVGVRLDALRHAKWAKMTDATIAAAITSGYRLAMASTSTPTPNWDSLSDLSKEKRATILGQITTTHQLRAAVVATEIGMMDAPTPELVQPAPDKRVPICLDTDLLRIDGVNTFLNTWSPDPEDAMRNGDLFIFRGLPALYSHRGGHLAERRAVKQLGSYELIAVTNERANVHETKQGEVKVSELTDHHAKVGLAAVRRTLARTLREVATTPIITPDGTLVEDRVYDAKTGVLVATNVEHEPPILEPSAEDIATAMKRLDDWYGDISFMTDGDRAAFWAYMFGVPLRRYINGDAWTAVPALGVRAGKANAGKTLVTSAIGGLHGAVSMRLPSTEEELHKRILSAYESNQSAQVLVLNNVPNGTVLDSAALAEVITEHVVQGRKLGFTGQDIEHRNNKLLIVNGNRWRPSDDLVSRFIPCSLKPHIGAETRQFRTPDLQQRIEDPKHHAEVLTCLLTVICGWLKAGATKGKTHGFRGNFADFIATMDGVLTYAGITGFGTNFEVFVDLDESDDEDFLAALVDYFGAGQTFNREKVEGVLRKADRDPGQDPTRAVSGFGVDSLPAPSMDPKFAQLELLRQRMPRDSRAPSPTAPGLRAPLSGKKLSRMLNGQVDMPVEREGKPLVTLRRVTVQGERCWRFEGDGTTEPEADASPF